MIIVLICFTLSLHAQVIDVNAPGQKFVHYWSKCVGAGRANEGLRAGWLEHLALVKEYCGFEYCRFHGLFHDDMFVYRKMNTRYKPGDIEFYNFQYLDDLFDRMLKIDVKPFIELGFFPKDMAGMNTKTQFWWEASITPPEEWSRWYTLVHKFTQHLVDRYGLEEVKTWYFEVWNEANISGGFWDSTKEKYFELYKVSANAVKDVHTDLRIGGPATSAFRRQKDEQTGNMGYYGTWVDDFLKYCEQEKLPVDFLSTHPYPHEWGFDAEAENVDVTNKRFITGTRDDMQWLNDALKRSAYPNAEIHLTEWNSSASSRDHMHDRLPAAAYLIRANLLGVGLSNSLSYWAFTDIFEEKGAGNTIFHGGFGMINYQGLFKPAFHAYRMLHQLGDEILYNNDRKFVTRHSNTNKVTTLLVHYPSEMQELGIPTSNYEDWQTAEKASYIGKPEFISLHLKGLPSYAPFVIEIMDKDHANTLKDWEAMGKPEPPTREQIEVLKAKSFETKKIILTANEQGEFNWKQKVLPWSCVLIKQL